MWDGRGHPRAARIALFRRVCTNLCALKLKIRLRKGKNKVCRKTKKLILSSSRIDKKLENFEFIFEIFCIFRVYFRGFFFVNFEFFVMADEVTIRMISS